MSVRARIAIISQRYGSVGGGERFAQEVTDRIAAKGEFEFHVLATAWESKCDLITFHRVPRLKFPRFLRPWFYGWWVGRMIAKGNFDLVHSHSGTAHADVYSTHGAPHEFWTREVLGRRPKLIDRMMIALERRMLAAAAPKVFMPVSSHLTRVYESVYGSLPGRWKVVHPGVDFAQFDQAGKTAARTEVRERYGIAHDAFVVLFVGMNFQSKGLEKVIRAVESVRQQRPEVAVHLLVVGRGDERRFAQIAAEVGCAAAVSFAGAQKAKIERYYAASDVLLMPATFETFCMVVLEGMAAGLPVIITDKMGVRDLVTDGVQGLVLTGGGSAAESVVATTAALMQVMDPRVRTRMGAAGRETARRQSWERVAAEVEQVYRDRLILRKVFNGKGKTS